MIKNKERVVGKILFIVYIFLLAYLLLFSAGYGRVSGGAVQYSKYNITLGSTISRYYFGAKNGSISIWVFLENVLGNIIIFIPLLPLLYLAKGWYFKYYIKQILALLFPLCIESLQYLFGLGVFDIDDIFLNAIGISIGYVLLINIMSKKNRTDKNKRK